LISYDYNDNDGDYKISDVDDDYVIMTS